MIPMAQASRALRIPLADFPGRAAVLARRDLGRDRPVRLRLCPVQAEGVGSTIDKGAIEGSLRVSSLMACNCATRRTFFLRPAPRSPRRGGPRVEGDIPSRFPRPPLGPTFGTDTVCVFDQPAQLYNDASGDFSYRLPATSSRSVLAHTENIGESDVWEIVKERQKID